MWDYTVCNVNYTVCNMMGLAFFAQRNSPLMHPGCCVFQWFIPSYFGVVFCSTDVPQFV